jgi:hypothetical protein
VRLRYSLKQKSYVFPIIGIHDAIELVFNLVLVAPFEDQGNLWPLLPELLYFLDQLDFLSCTPFRSNKKYEISQYFFRSGFK